MTGLPFILKGVATAEDAVLAVEHGVSTIYVSNHGGRQLDHGRATIEMLPEIVDAVHGRAEIVLAAALFAAATCSRQSLLVRAPSASASFRVGDSPRAVKPACYEFSKSSKVRSLRRWDCLASRDSVSSAQPT